MHIADKFITISSYLFQFHFVCAEVEHWSFSGVKKDIKES